MRLNNKELKVVVDEIYKRVSQPIIEANKKITDLVVIDDDYTRDCVNYDFFETEIQKLQDLKSELVKKWRDFNVGNTNLGYNPLGSISRQSYSIAKKMETVGIVKYPTKEEIESQIIIAGYSEIPELITQITAMYQ